MNGRPLTLTLALTLTLTLTLPRYEDGPKSFYTVYAQLFAALDAEERAATPGRAPAPGFGSSTEAWGEVRALYAGVWETWLGLGRGLGLGLGSLTLTLTLTLSLTLTRCASSTPRGRPTPPAAAARSTTSTTCAAPRTARCAG